MTSAIVAAVHQLFTLDFGGCGMSEGRQAFANLPCVCWWHLDIDGSLLDGRALLECHTMALVFVGEFISLGWWEREDLFQAYMTHDLNSFSLLA